MAEQAARFDLRKYVEGLSAEDRSTRLQTVNRLLEETVHTVPLLPERVVASQSITPTTPDAGLVPAEPDEDIPLTPVEQQRAQFEAIFAARIAQDPRDEIATIKHDLDLARQVIGIEEAYQRGEELPDDPDDLLTRKVISAIKDALAKGTTMAQILTADNAEYSQLLDEALQKYGTAGTVLPKEAIIEIPESTQLPPEAPATAPEQATSEIPGVFAADSPAKPYYDKIVAAYRQLSTPQIQREALENWATWASSQPDPQDPEVIAVTRFLYEHGRSPKASEPPSPVELLPEPAAPPDIAAPAAEEVELTGEQRQAMAREALEKEAVFAQTNNLTPAQASRVLDYALEHNLGPDGALAQMRNKKLI